MILLKNPLIRMASTNPAGGAFRSILAAMALEAGIMEDLFARASYIEGLTGEKPGSISKNPRPLFKSVSDALALGEVLPPIASSIQDIYRISDKDLAALFGFRDLDLFGALLRGATKAMPRGSARGITPEDVAMSIASGLSPLTYKPMKYGPGRNVFHYLGEKAHGSITIGGIAAILQAEAFNRATDIVRGTSKGEGQSISLNTPVGGDDSEAVIGDLLSDEGSTGNSLDLLYAIFNDPAVLSVVNREMQSRLGGEMQKAVWNVVAVDPSIIEVSGGKVGVSNRALATAIAERAGLPYSRSLEVSAGKQFRDKVWPAFQEVVGDPSVLAPILRNHDIQQVIFDATRGQSHMASHRSAGVLSMRRNAFVRSLAKSVVAKVLK